MFELQIAYVMTVYCILFLVAICVAAYRTRRWVAVNAELVSLKTFDKELIGGGGRSLMAVGENVAIESISYAYRWNGKTFNGHMCYILKIKPFSGPFTRKFIKEIDAATKKRALTAFVNPRQPARAVLKKGAPWEMLALCAFVCILGVLVILLIAFAHPTTMMMHMRLLEIGGILGLPLVGITVRLLL